MGIWDGLGGAIAGPLIGGIASAFTGGPKLPKELKDLYRLQRGQADQLRRFSQSIPLSNPQEQAALASQRGLFGEQARNSQAQAGAGYNMNFGQQGLPDFLSGLSLQQQGGLQDINAQSMQQALLARQNAVGQSAQIAQGAVGSVQYQPQQDLGASFGSLARLIGYNQTMGAARRQQQQDLGALNKSVDNYGTKPPPVQSNTPQMDFPGQTGQMQPTGAITQSHAGGGMPVDWAALGNSGALGSPVGLLRTATGR